MTSTTTTAGPGAGPGTGSVWADREFRGLWASWAVTLAGDQLARVAVTVLIFQRTGSAGWAAAGYAVTMLPALVGGPLLSGLADRYPRRQVMIACDLLCAVLAAAMAVPGLPLPAAAGLLFVVTLLASPFTAARSALTRDVFPDDRYASAVAVGTLTTRAAVVAGYAAGGILVAGLGPHRALLVNAATFAASALVVRVMVTTRPAPAATGSGGSGHGLVAGVRLVFGNPALRTLTLFAWLAAFHISPSAVAVPYAATHGGGPVAVGLLLAASSGGAGLATWVLAARVPPERRLRLVIPLALLASAPLMATAANPGLVLTCLLWALAGAGCAYQLAANVAFMAAIPNHLRGQAFGLVATGLAAGQGLGALATGALAEPLGPAAAVAVLGAAGTLSTLALTPAARTYLHPPPPASGASQGRAPA